MKADLTRNTFKAINHFTRVIMQQGRVQLDADWNEQTSILLHYMQALATDLIGEHGGNGNSFAISLIPNAQGPFDFLISPGRYYVNGLLCEIETPQLTITGYPAANQISVAHWDGLLQKMRYVLLADPVSGSNQIAQITAINRQTQTLTVNNPGPFTGQQAGYVQPLYSYLTQPNYPGAVTPSVFPAQVYLDVWEQLVTYVQADEIREVALGGADTTARGKLVWQVRVTPGGTAANQNLPACLTPENIATVYQPANRGLLKARAMQKGTSTDPCIIAPNASYRGPENQLYRVEIHTGSHGLNGAKTTPTFKWSRENGSVVFPITGGGGTNSVSIESLGRDDRFGLTEGNWIEVQDDSSALQTQAGALLQVQSIDSTSRQIELTGTPDSAVGGDLTLHPLLRRWDQTAGANDEEDGLPLGADGAVLIDDSGTSWLDLEDGIQIQFQTAPARGAWEYRTGDYWLIPARTATGDVEWPTETYTDSQGNTITGPIAKPPDGITHSYAPLAVITAAENGNVSDCRNVLNRLVRKP